MAKKLGNDYRLWIESVTPGTYNEIKGGRALSYSRSGQQIDTTTKDNFPYGTSAPGSRSLTVTASFVPDLPDATGYTRLETIANAASSTPTKFQIRKGGSAGSGTDVVLAGEFYVNEMSTDLGQNAVAEVSVTLGAASAPTTDVLA